MNKIKKKAPLCNINNINTWTRYKKGLCRTCFSGCCTLLIEITAQDIVRLGIASEDELCYSKTQVIKELKKKKIIKRYNARTEKFTLQEKANGDCPFLDTSRLCSVYRKRPQVCRDHPLTASPRKGYCPYQEKK